MPLFRLLCFALLLLFLPHNSSASGFHSALKAFNAFAWGAPMIVLLVGTGLFLSLRFKLIQLRGFRHGINVLRGKYDDPNDPGELSHFKALTTALSATIGTGNIVGVAAAILMGGPGAVFWMWVTAFVGMATKFTSCTLAVHYRHVDQNGESHGGPMHYIVLGMGSKYRWLAVLFASFTIMASFGAGNMFQANNVMTSLHALIYGREAEIQQSFRAIMAVVLAVSVGAVILGGLQRIANFSSKIVPLMVVLYFGSALIILFGHLAELPAAFGTIFHGAFHAPEAMAGGLLGSVIRHGVARGVFSNEAGLGSAAIAHGAAQTNEPVREGLVAMLGPFIDTIVVCTMTALVIVVTGAHNSGMEAGLVTSVAFESGLSGSGFIVNLGVVLFAFSTIISWSYYGDRTADFLFGPAAVKPYRLLYTLMVAVGCMIQLGTVLDISDTTNGLMALPNLIALAVLSPVVARLTVDYFKRMKLAGSK